ncbi:MAG: hypothetical protein DI536_06490 [Archangium gephyra]|uniref:Uncharacterized protein n=1 Tax=Archangium gephyra TaxID=48 RepID=A0A2W5TZQ9_9BACT|nr:MAG: hypothetical protein DI536_06490 [Archangium gephyra]
MFRLKTLWLAALLTACGPNPPAPVQIMALIPSEAGTLETRQVELKTVGNVTTLKGDVVEFIGSPRVVVDANDPLQTNGIENLTDQQRYDVLVKDKGADVRGHYVDRSGVLWPADFHTWNMVSAYYNFERSYEYFNDIYDGVDPKELRPLKVMYWADVKLNGADQLQDNALYLSFIKSFVLTPFQNAQLVPLPMNIGIIGHETAHRVFNFRVLEDQGIHPALTRWTIVPFNLLKSLDEGLADYHGYSVTCFEAANCRPNFLAASIDDSRTVGFRNVGRVDACMDETTRQAFLNFNNSQWVTSPEMYKVGNLIAASLYQAGNRTAKEDVLRKALILAYDDESPTNPGLRQFVKNNLNTPENFTPENVVNIIVSHVTDPDLKKELCTQFTTRMQLRCSSFPCEVNGLPSMRACPSTARREMFCPTLPPQP